MNPAWHTADMRPTLPRPASFAAFGAPDRGTGGKCGTPRAPWVNPPGLGWVDRGHGENARAKIPVKARKSPEKVPWEPWVKPPDQKPGSQKLKPRGQKSRNAIP